MEWSARAIVLGTRRHGETDLILEVMTREHGRHLGLVRGGKSRKQQPVLQPGNELDVTWRARLAEHLGTFAIEPQKLRAADLMTSAVGVHGVQHIAALLRLLPERDAHVKLYDALGILLNHLDTAEVAAPLLVHFELELLNELGVGLDLETCAATGIADDLAWVSPKSGRAVSREAGEPYRDKLLPLPSFLVPGQRQPGSEITSRDLAEAFALTSFFLERHVYGPRGLTENPSREPLLRSLAKAQQA